MAASSRKCRLLSKALLNPSSSSSSSSFSFSLSLYDRFSLSSSDFFSAFRSPYTRQRRSVMNSSADESCFPTSGCGTLANLRYAALISVVSAPICTPSSSYCEELVVAIRGDLDLAVVLSVVAKLAVVGGDLVLPYLTEITKLAVIGGDLVVA